MSRHVSASLLFLSGLLCALAGCEGADSQAESPQPRRLVPLAKPNQDLFTVLLDEPHDLPLGKGEAYILAFEQPLEVGKEHTLEITYEGQRPDILTSRKQTAALRRLEEIPGLHLDGRMQHLLRPIKSDQTVEVRAHRGPCKLLRVTLRQWGSRGFTLTPPQEKQSFSDVDIYGDHRAALQLAPGEHWQVDVAVPADAHWLEFDVATLEPRLGQDKEARSTGGSHLLVEASESSEKEKGSQALGSQIRHTTPLYDARAPSKVEVWSPLRLDVRSLAGRRVRLSISNKKTSHDSSATDPGAAAKLAISVPAWACIEGARRPNLVIISLDTTRADHLGAYGYPRNTTPRLDAFAREAVLFREATSTSAYTLPAHATLFSGQYPTTHGAEHPAHALSTTRTPLLAPILQEEGYATRGLTGGGYLDADFGFAHGFRAYSDNDPVLALEKHALKNLDSTVEGQRYVAARKSQHWRSAIEWIEQNQELPFFLFLHTFVVHDYRPRPELRTLFGHPPSGEDWVQPLRTLPDQVQNPYSQNEVLQLIDLYDAALREADNHLGQLFEALDALELTEDTIVVITSDHGEDFAEHSVQDTPLVGHGHGLWQSQLAIPLIIRAPGLEGREVTQRVSLVDVAPTLLELLGLPAQPAMQGRSLLPLMKGGPGTPSPALAELHSAKRSARAYFSGQWKLVTGDPEAPVELPVPKPTRLYDLHNDPLEKVDLQQEKKRAIETLRRQHDDLVTRLSLERQSDNGDNEAVLSEETRKRLVELGYVDGG
ncbi:MAG: sulfatase [Planctomycetota bacterium]|nr:sulfatase [Planctomycetota bacterium]